MFSYFISVTTNTPSWLEDQLIQSAGELQRFKDKVMVLEWRVDTWTGLDWTDPVPPDYWTSFSSV